MIEFLVVALLFLSGCAASLIPGHYRESLYHWHSGMPWRIHIADQYTVSLKCNEVIPGLGIFVSGCTIPKTREVWMIDSLIISLHECNHLRKVDSRDDLTTEWIQDIIYRWLLDNVMFSLTWPIPAAEKPCGEGYVYGSDPNNRWLSLPSVREYEQLRC